MIIARGATANALKERQFFIPVVEIPFAGNDLVRSQHESKLRFGCNKVAVIGTYSMIMGVESLSDIVGLDIKSFVLPDSYYYNDLIDSIKEQGFNVLVGGLRTVQYAASIGMNAVMVKPGKEPIWQSITEAKRVAYVSRREQEKTQRFKTILDHVYEGVIAVDKNDDISFINSASEKILGINRNKAIGKKVDDVMPKSKIAELVNDSKEYLDEIIKHNDIQLAINKVPIVLKGESVGNVLTFQNASRIQVTESKIREKIYSRGHIAKYTFNDIIGESRKIKEVIMTSKGFSQVDSNILIYGDTGTGKELFAQSIHNYSGRSSGPFVAVNCAALPENLLESELFGYVEGAFTGAVRGGKPGLFELAHNGTIFLDEISEVSPKLQGRLLRVIQEKEIMRLGHDRVIPVDVRIISATNKDLYTQAQMGDFRKDLYYRLDILKISLPSISERSEDIPLLVDHFIKNYSIQFRKEGIKITNMAKKLMQQYSWSGNIRELQNICERLVVLSTCNVIDEEDVEAVLMTLNSAVPVTPTHNSIIVKVNANQNHDEDADKLEKERIAEVLLEVGYNKIMAAEKLGMSRTTLWRRRKELKIK